MSRANYSNDYETWSLICWRGAVASAIRGKRGQAFLRELLEALDSLSEKQLIANDLERDGSVCAIGAIGLKRGIDMEKLDPEDHERVAAEFGISEALAREIFYINDDDYKDAESRFAEVRKWAESQLRANP